MICKNCNKEIPDGKKFCIYCGAKVENQEDIQIPKRIQEDSVCYSNNDNQNNKFTIAEESKSPFSESTIKTDAKTIETPKSIKKIDKKSKLVYSVILTIVIICCFVGIGTKMAYRNDSKDNSIASSSANNSTVQAIQKTEDAENSKGPHGASDNIDSDKSKSNSSLNTDYYLGTWGYSNITSSLYVDISKEDENYFADVSLYLRGGNTVLDTGKMLISPIDNTLIGEFDEDNWGNAGNVIIELNNDSIILTIQSHFKEDSDPALKDIYNMDCDNLVLNRIQDTVTEKEMSAEEFRGMTVSDIENIYGTDYTTVNQDINVEVNYNDSDIPYSFIFLPSEYGTSNLYSTDTVYAVMVNESGNIDSDITTDMTLSEIASKAKNGDASISPPEDNLNDGYLVVFSSKNHEGTVYALASDMDSKPYSMFIKFD